MVFFRRKPEAHHFASLDREFHLLLGRLHASAEWGRRTSYRPFGYNVRFKLGCAFRTETTSRHTYQEITTRPPNNQILQVIHRRQRKSNTPNPKSQSSVVHRLHHILVKFDGHSPL